jgi:uncharacterized protein YaeQ
VTAFYREAMALRSTIFKANLQLADLDRPHFGDYSLTLARHPSETDERLMVRLLAFALYADPMLTFGKGLSNEDEAALAQTDPTGEISRWIEVGLPDETRLKKACNRARQVVVLAYGGKAVDVWWKQNAGLLSRFQNLTILQLGVQDSQILTNLADRNMKLSWTIQEGTIYLGDEQIGPLTQLLGV